MSKKIASSQATSSKPVGNDYEIVRCAFCGGTGRYKVGLILTPCRVCDGEGVKKIDFPNVKCASCGGTGRSKAGLTPMLCRVCNGVGYIGL
jgi:hypothetical protein